MVKNILESDFNGIAVSHTGQRKMTCSHFLRGFECITGYRIQYSEQRYLGPITKGHGGITFFFPFTQQHKYIPIKYIKGNVKANKFIY